MPLNNEQSAAANAPLGNSLIIASAGTGKTSTIVARIAHLLNLGISPNKILLLTFTNKAAKEMISRLQKQFSQNITSQILAGTFHSVSYQILRKLGKNVLLKSPSELKSLLKSIASRRKFSHISDTKPYGGAYLYDVYSLYQNKILYENFSEWFCKNYEDQAQFSEIYADILCEFEDEKTKFGYVDFNDLLIKMRNEFKKGAPIFFDEVLVDEYQDTNTLQGSLIDAIPKKSLFCVGDFDQSIYAFNGANIEIIGSFSKRYKNAQIYALNINYRSSSLIIALANKVIANNPRLYEKNLVVHRQGAFKAPILLTFNELFSQYSGIADYVAKSPYKHENIAIIFRNNSSADGLEIALREKNIKSKRKGGISFFESKEIKAITDIIAICINERDIMGFIGVMEYAKGANLALVKKIFDDLIKLGNENIINGLISPNLSVNLDEKRIQSRQLGLFDDLDEFSEISRFNALNFDENFMNNPILKNSKITENTAIFLYELRNLLKILKNNNSSNFAINSIIDSKLFSMIVEILSTSRATLKNGSVDNDRKIEIKDKIYVKAKALLEIAKNYSTLEKFHTFITIGSREIEEGEGVNLLSIHASKGLEFEQVFIVDLAQNRFPNFKLMSMGGNIEEERRLFYVAVTRAKDELILSYARYDKIRKISYHPSQFLVEAGMAQNYE